MEKDQRTRLQKATQDARRLLEEEFRSQLLQTYDIDVKKVHWAEQPGAHLLAEQRLIREKLIAWIEHKEAQINDRKEALLLALREMAFTALNRFVALKLMEARELVRPCVSGGLESAGFLEFTAVAQGLLADQESSYRLYLETIFEDVSRELRALFDPRDPASLLWPKRAALLELLDILNRPELGELWREDETLGWVYQYFNGDAERKKMREESAAPRNSRELAVRNQFFTPRYVVEFLTDNTLGRIWYEMRQGQTELKDRCRYLVRRPNEVWLQPGEVSPAEVVEDESLGQEELLQKPVHIANRPLKDPREIRMLDPACGSMHFGLYAFDLYLAIYEEAWEIAQGSDEQAKEGEVFASFVAYAAGFASKAAFLREVPKLILLYNIHGIDIDPRATQIARLTLWLRAQRAWLDQRLDAADRPPINRSNVVCAEPMPGERELLADFVDQQFPEAERGLVQQLLEAIFDKMQLAGEAGSLLKIEHEIRDAVVDARREWQKLAVQQKDLFSAAELAELGQVGASLNDDLQNLTRDFWGNIEGRIYSSLHEYADQAESTGYQRRLFAEDAAGGFAFIDACRKSYDAVVMNPPFGNPAKACLGYLKSKYESAWTDIYGSFLWRFLYDRDDKPLVGAITSSLFMFTKPMRFVRSAWVDSRRLHCMVELGPGVLDAATVDTALTVSLPGPADRTSFIDLTANTSKSTELLRNARDPGSGTTKLVPIEMFKNLYLQPFCYYMGASKVSLWKEPDRVDPSLGTVTKGNQTFDDFRFQRLRWEQHYSSIGIHWFGYEEGGEFQPYTSPTPVVYNWHNDGREARAFQVSKYGTDAQVRQSIEWWWKPGITHPRVGLGLGPRIMPPGHIFSGDSISLFLNDNVDCLPLLTILASTWGEDLASAFGRYRKKEVRATANLPVQRTWLGSARSELTRLGQEFYSRVSEIERINETSPIFCIPAPLRSRFRHEITEYLKNLSDKIDDLVGSLIFGDDLNSVTPLALRRSALVERYTSPEKDSLSCQASEWISYSIGVIYGRWDLRNAVGDIPIPAPPAHFEPLPIYPPGQLLAINGLPYEIGDKPIDYPIEPLRDAILVDDSNHQLDIERRVFQVLEIILGKSRDGRNSDAIPLELCEALEAKSLRDYLRKPAGFFADHLKLYSKSRRQAPVYWQLSAGSGSYSAWLYYNHFTQDTLYRALRDFVEPRIRQAEREQFELESQGALSGDAATRLQEAQTLLQDLRILKSELDIVAPLWNPNLNDGVIINHAILWRITPYTPWQKKCKECWDKLVKGDYDWAHLAFHLWPERVIPKCTTDRSLAIAHGLEERLWQETNNGNWLPRQLSEADLQALIAEHSNPAVKSALEQFLAAPPPVAPTRTRASRSTRSTGSSAPRRPRGTAAVVDAEATRQVLLALTAAPSDGLAKAAIADLIGVEANALTAVIKQLKDSGQIDQLGERRGARYVLSEQGRAAVASETEVEA